MMDDDKLDKLLGADPLAEAERMTGEDYKIARETMALGMLLHIEKGNRVREEMESRDDTHYSTNFETTLRIYQEEGFEVIYSEAIAGTKDLHVILWHPDGILATVESYTMSFPGDVPGTNTSKIYANWKPADHEKARGQYTHSGHYPRSSEEWVWIGDWDMRTGLRHTLERLRNNGTFVNPWIEQPFLWLLNYKDTKDDDYDYKAINRRKLSAFPEHVLNAIGFEAE